jgi:hypothetical protein
VQVTRVSTQVTAGAKVGYETVADAVDKLVKFAKPAVESAAPVVNVSRSPQSLDLMLNQQGGCFLVTCFIARGCKPRSPTACCFMVECHMRKMHVALESTGERQCGRSQVKGSTDLIEDSSSLFTFHD